MSKSHPDHRHRVMGATGSGKTSVSSLSLVLMTRSPRDCLQFINIASGSKLRVGKKLDSCTDKVQPTDEFNLDGRGVILVDTPGFDDTSKSDTEILETIAAFLATT